MSKISKEQAKQNLITICEKYFCDRSICENEEEFNRVFVEFNRLFTDDCLNVLTQCNRREHCNNMVFINQRDYKFIDLFKPILMIRSAYYAGGYPEFDEIVDIILNVYEVI